MSKFSFRQLFVILETNLLLITGGRLDARFPYVAIQFAAALALLGIAFIGWRRRHTRGADALVALSLSLSFWALGASLENAQTELAPALFWAKFKYFGLLLTPPVWLIFTLTYTGRIVRPSRGLLALLSIHPVLSLLLVWTTEYHGLYWSSFRIAYEQPAPMFDTTRGGLYGVVAAYIYLLILGGMWVLLRHAWNTRSLYRAQSLLMVLAVLIPLFANILFLANLIKLEGFDPTPFAFAVTGIIIAFGLLRLRLLDLVPVARYTIIENMNDGVLVLDAYDRVVDLNPAMATLLGGSARQYIGEPVEALYEAHPELRQMDDALPHQRQGRFYERQTAPIYSRHQRLEGRFYVYRDVTQQQAVEAVLNTRVQQLATLRRVDDALMNKLDVEYVLNIAIDAAMDLSRAESGGIALVEDGEVRLVNTRGKYRELLTDTYPPRASGIVARVIRECKPVLISDVSKDPDYLSAIPDTHAQITIPLVSRDLLIGVLNLETPESDRFTQDVFELIKLVTARISVALDNARLYQQARQHLTELQTLYGKVRYLELLKTDMIRIAAHDLRNPIHLVNSYAELLQDDLSDVLDDQHRQFLESIKRAASQMLRITNNVLSPERIEQNAETMQILDLSRIVEEVYAAHTDQARQKRLKYEVAVPEQPLKVNGDAVQLGEALTNLIVNAIKYTPPGGRILVSLVQQRTRATVSIEDTGFGIPLEQQEKLFQPFFRADMPETKDIEGTGLGLHLVKNIVDRHFGKVFYQSGQGGGSTFGFELPVVQDSY